MQFSVAVRNAINDSIEATIGISAKLQLYASGGTMPANCATASNGTKIIEYNLVSDWAAASASGVKSLNTLPLTANGLAAGVIDYYRFMDSLGTTCGEQGTVSMPWSGATAYVLGNKRVNGGNIYNVTTAGTSAATGGPTGTGASIADGTVVWAYVSVCDMTIDNTNVALNQTVNVTTFNKTAPGA